MNHNCQQAYLKLIQKLLVQEGRRQEAEGRRQKAGGQKAYTVSFALFSTF